MSDFKPMLASKVNPTKLRFPLAVQPKLDGIRAVVKDGRLLTRTLKTVPNREIYEALSRPELEGLDGELLVGDPTAEDAYRRTASFCMAESKTGEPWTFYVFDRWNSPLLSFTARRPTEIELSSEPRIELVTTVLVDSAEELEAVEAKLIELGHEGAIVRDPNGFYKFGRASATKGELGKLKRFDDSEAEIIAPYEEQHNANVAVTNALGRTERSTAKAGKTGKGTLGGFYVRDCVTGIEFKVGTGFDASERADLWAQWHADPRSLSGKVLKYKSFNIGVKEKPRHPVFLGFRDLTLDGGGT
jgi:DNA ligase-1